MKARQLPLLLRLLYFFFIGLPLAWLTRKDAR